MRLARGAEGGWQRDMSRSSLGQGRAKGGVWGRGVGGVRGIEARWGHYGWRDAPRRVYSTYTRVRAAYIVWDHNVCVCVGGVCV